VLVGVAAGGEGATVSVGAGGAVWVGVVGGVGDGSGGRVGASAGVGTSVVTNPQPDTSVSRETESRTIARNILIIWALL
jgi:hypothetical protein